MEAFLIRLPALLQGLFFFALGACVGSFVNVIAWRWPRGQEITRPASRCGTCGRSLSWWENIPVISWLALRGRCRTCVVRLGWTHMVVEIGCGALFTLTVAALFMGPFREPVEPDAAWWLRAGAMRAAPLLAGVLMLWLCLLAASLIDAETGLIPLGLTSAAMITGLVATAVQGLVWTGTGVQGSHAWPLGWPSPQWTGAGLGGLLGLCTSMGLLWSGRLPRSFATLEDITQVEPAQARREMGKELCFLIAPATGVCLGWVFAPQEPSEPLRAIASSSLGLLVGGGAIWATRILGTVAFGREAMGLGDVHLLAAAGTVIGWRDCLIAYLLAPFLALAWLAVSGGLARLRGKAARELPYGPHLALACVVVFLGRPWVVPVFRQLFALPPDA
jgi:leader peptidase (prepilin peptidase)/N-methyltransferase